MSNMISFEVEFLSDIVLPASSNTEGNIAQLDFIPGSNFLGIVACEYDEFEDSFAVFHSSKVRFEDATIVHNGKKTYKMPLSFFHEKSKKDTLYNHHLIADFSKFEQLKQKRKGYITEDLQEIEVKYNYSQKSAYDSNNRKSKDSSMYGYMSIKSGTKWQFSLKYDGISDNDLARIKKNLIGTKRLGKSKSSQYGSVNISECKTLELLQSKTSDETILYANSRISLVDEEGNPTLDLQYLFNGLQAKQIDYPKCQLKTSSFTPYNNARKTKDYERVCINKGSVIVLKDVAKENIPHFVGAYQSEGFGELLLNPSFLLQNEFELKSPKLEKKEIEKKEIKSEFIKVLLSKQEYKNNKLNLLNNVDKFVRDKKNLYKKLNSSQWGTICSICTSKSENFKEDIKDYISSGKVSWSSEQIKSLLDNSEHTLEFIKLAAMQMQKEKCKKVANNE